MQVVQTMPMQSAVVPPQNRTIRHLAISHIIIGTVAIICGVLAIVMLDDGWLKSVGGGVWGGIWFVLTGIIGLTTVSRFGAFIAFNVISIVITFINGAMFFTVGVIHYVVYCMASFDDDDDDDDYGRCAYKTSALILYVILAILMVIEFFVSIIAAAYGCKYACCAHRNQNQSMGQVLIPPSQSPVSTAGYSVVYQPGASAPIAYYPTQGAYPQQTGVATYPGHMMVSQPPPAGMYIGAQGQQMVPQMAYPGQQMPAQTDIVYSAQSADFNMAPPPYNPKAPPPPYNAKTPPY